MLGLLGLSRRNGRHSHKAKTRGAALKKGGIYRDRKPESKGGRQSLFKTLVFLLIMVLGLIASRRKAENTKKGIIETISASRITKRDREHMITIDDGFLLYLSEKSTGKKIKRRKREKKRRENKQSDAVFEIRQGILKHFVLDVANDLGRALPSSSSFETFMGWHDTKVYYCRTNCGLGNLNVIKISVPFDHFPAFSPTQIASSFYDENFTDLGQIKSPLMIFSATTVQKWRIRNLFKTAKVDTSIFTLASLDGLHFFTVNYNKENSINNNSNSYREQSFEIVETDWTASSSARFSVVTTIRHDDSSLTKREATRLAKKFTKNLKNKLN